MASRASMRVSVQSKDNRDLPATQATVTQVTFDQVDRTRNALRFAGMGMVATFVSIFIPILHWFLVPSLFIGSLVLAMDKYGEQSRNEGGEGECPKCHKQFRVQPSTWKEKVSNNCDHCHEDLEMKLIQ